MSRISQRDRIHRVEIARGVTLYEDNGIWLEMTKQAVERDAMKRLMSFMTGRVVDLAFVDAPKGMEPGEMQRVAMKEGCWVYRVGDAEIPDNMGSVRPDPIGDPGVV